MSLHKRIPLLGVQENNLLGLLLLKEGTQDFCIWHSLVDQSGLEYWICDWICKKGLIRAIINI